jgi:hypothetical protein
MVLRDNANKLYHVGSKYGRLPPPDFCVSSGREHGRAPLVRELAAKIGGPMKRFTVTLVLMAAAVLFGSAQASTDAERVAQIMKMARASVVLPAAWDGEWSRTDTVYTCAGVFQSTSTSTDTICGGKDFSPNSGGSPLTLNCSGTSDATSYNIHCVGSADSPPCTLNLTVDGHGTLTGGLRYTVTTVNTAYTGTDPLCSLLPPQCIQVNSHATYIGPAPPVYCSTPSRHTTWGEVKTIYH